ncbi:MAG: extracellular solute-binding protein [Spirochaetaceae bacterium]|jgi:raffinose/stachyose/melibiose transport system substrate-binding protein|nr:extracellular solute-binding protein [Spirochaetaceae bacterium]
MKRTLGVSLLLGMLALFAVSAVFGGGSGDKGKAAVDSGQFKSRTLKMLSIWDNTDPKTDGYLITELSREYGKTVSGFDLDYEYVSITELDQKIAVLLANNDLPDICVFESGSRLKPVIATGQILDMDKTFRELGIRDCLDEGAVSLLKNLVDNVGLYDLPLGLNMEGFWYHKGLFQKAGITSTPKTWTEFLAVCEKLKQAGITPIVQGGKDQWPMTRVLNGYVVRSIGLDAVGDAVGGKTKFTDAKYAAAAQMFADMAKKGYFVEGMNTIDPSTASAMLMNGQAAMKYDGSWFAGNLNDPEQNLAGPDGIGFFNVPLVESNPAGGTLDDYSMNCGNILMFSSKKYDAAVADWMKYVFPRYGDYAMQKLGAFKGYKITQMPANLPVYTRLVADTLSSAKGSFLWFEAKMPVRASEMAQENISLLYNGEMTPQRYMEILQNSLR